MTDETTALAALVRTVRLPDGRPISTAMANAVIAALDAANVRVAPSPTEERAVKRAPCAHGDPCRENRCVEYGRWVAPSPDAPGLLRRNVLIHDGEDATRFDGEWVAVPREDFDGLRRLLDDLNAGEAHWHKRATLAEAELARLAALPPRDALDVDNLWLGIEITRVGDVTFTEPMVPVSSARTAIRAALAAQSEVTP